MVQRRSSRSRTTEQRRKHNERVRRWRRQFYDKGFTYKKVNGHWTWVKKKKTRKTKYAHLFEE